MAIVLIGGGSRSGKSRFALERARKEGSRLAFIATADTLDDEVNERIEAYKASNDGTLHTIEEPLEITGVLGWQASRCDAIVVDSLTVWLANLIHAGRKPEVESQRLLSAALASAARVVLVTNEVGCGIAPETELARRFRDHAGRLNQQAAEAAGEVYWMAFGCPIKVK